MLLLLYSLLYLRAQLCAAAFLFPCFPSQSRRSRSSVCSDVYAVATPFRVRVALLNMALQTATLRIRHLAADEAAYVSWGMDLLMLALTLL